MNTLRRSFLTLLGAGAAALVAPSRALAEQIRILPDGGPTPLLVPGQGSPDLERALGRLTVGPAVTQGALAVLWLAGRDADASRLPILTLDEARAGGALIVTERGQATVPELIAENRGKTYVLLLAGEILIGGKQNRVLREDLLLPPRSGPRNIGVYCVEQGRWNEGRKDFESRASVVQPSVRSHVLRGAPQSRIWSGVAIASRDAAARSATGSYQAIYDEPEVKAHLDRATKSFDATAQPSTMGAAVFVGPALAGVDCFHSPSLFAREWPKLLRAYALEAYRASGAWDETAARAQAEKVLRAAARTEGRLRGNAGVGQLFEFGVEGRRGAALLFEGQAIHVALL
jgi:hypothetical protein